MIFRHAAVVAGLALGLASGTAQAAPITYSIDFNVKGVGRNDVARVVGSITTDGKIGVLSDADIRSFDLSSNGLAATSLSISGAQVRSTVSGDLDFAFDKSGGYLQALAVNVQVVTLFDDVDDPDIVAFTGFDANGVESVTAIQDPGTVFTIGNVSTVPLPASAPMFGAALFALGTFGYRVKRKKTTVA